jgi:hypothetical protein
VKTSNKLGRSCERRTLVAGIVILLFHSLFFLGCKFADLKLHIQGAEPSLGAMRQATEVAPLVVPQTRNLPDDGSRLVRSVK